MQEPATASPITQSDPAMLPTVSKASPQRLALPQLFEQLHTSEEGLTSQEARRRLSEEGPNELGTVQRIAGFRQLLLLFTNPLVLILLAASIVSAVFGEVLDASIDFMIFIGPISSIFDFLTFFVMLAVFHAAEPLFHSGWFVESLATQTLVLFIIRTSGNPLRSRPSLPLTVTVLTIVAVGLILPYTPLAVPLKFTPLPGLYFLFLAGAMMAYLLLVEVVKRMLMRRWLGAS